MLCNFFRTSSVPSSERMFGRRVLCARLGNTCRIPSRRSALPENYHRLRLSRRIEVRRGWPVPSVTESAQGIKTNRGTFTTSETPTPEGHVMFTSSFPSITAPSATSTFIPTFQALFPLIPSIPCGLSTLPCISSLKMDFPMARPVGICGETIESGSPEEPCKTGSKPREKKGGAYVNGPYLDDVLREFSGYIAIDEVYDGPFCILVVVDNKKFHRLLVEVLDHSPDHSDIHRFLTRFCEILIQRSLVVKGITTDGSPLYPEPLGVHFPGVPHQLCEFHVIKEVNLAVLRALAQVRKEIKKSIPKVKRGKADGKREIKARRKKARLEKKITELFENRYLLVQRILSPQERKCLNRITRGYPVLRRFREIIDGVYSLFDRRCKLETGIKKLEALRARVLRFQDVYTTLKKILSPNLEKALTFLDEKLLPSTSNGVERENRRFRKMQKSVYRVRTHRGVTQRIALDMIRGVRFRQRPRIIGFLQEFRNG